MALWDALAKAAGLPLAVLLGGSLAPVPAYNSNGLWLTEVDTLAKEIVLPAAAATEEVEKPSVTYVAIDTIPAMEKLVARARRAPRIALASRVSDSSWCGHRRLPKAWCSSRTSVACVTATPQSAEESFPIFVRRSRFKRPIASRPSCFRGR